MLTQHAGFPDLQDKRVFTENSTIKEAQEIIETVTAGLESDD